MAISDWSTTADSNNASPPNGWPEGMAASNINNCARQMMADIRTWYGAFELKNTISPAAMNTTENDYAPTGFSDATVIRLTPDATSGTTMTGLAGGTDGRVVLLVNIHASKTVTLPSESSSSVAANRFAFSGSISLQAKNGCVLWYDGTSSRWRMVSFSL